MGSTDVIRWIRRGGDLSVTAGMHDYTIGHAAAAYDQPMVLKAWIAGGGPLHATDAQGSTIGHVAITHRHEACLSLWLCAGGDPNARDRSGASLSDCVFSCVPLVMHRDLMMPCVMTGACILSSEHPSRTSFIRDMTEGHRHACVQVTHAACCLLMGDGIPNRLHPAFQTTEGRSLAMRIVPVISDPLHLATWLQAMG
jgi:hypothetical protein